MVYPLLCHCFSLNFVIENLTLAFVTNNDFNCIIIIYLTFSSYIMFSYKSLDFWFHFNHYKLYVCVKYASRLSYSPFMLNNKLL